MTGGALADQRDLGTDAHRERKGLGCAEGTSAGQECDGSFKRIGSPLDKHILPLAEVNVSRAVASLFGPRERARTGDEAGNFECGGIPASAVGSNIDDQCIDTGQIRQCAFHRAPCRTHVRVFVAATETVERLDDQHPDASRPSPSELVVGTAPQRLVNVVGVDDFAELTDCVVVAILVGPPVFRTTATLELNVTIVEAFGEIDQDVEEICTIVNGSARALADETPVFHRAFRKHRVPLIDHCPKRFEGAVLVGVCGTDRFRFDGAGADRAAPPSADHQHSDPAHERRLADRMTEADPMEYVDDVKWRFTLVLLGCATASTPPTESVPEPAPPQPPTASEAHSPVDPLAACVADPRPTTCFPSAHDALSANDRTLAFRALTLGCGSRTEDYCHWYEHDGTETGTEAARRLSFQLCAACADGRVEACGFDSILTPWLSNGLNQCERGDEQACSDAAKMLLRGCGALRDVVRAAALFDELDEETQRELYAIEEVVPFNGELVDPPSTRPARLRMLSAGQASSEAVFSTLMPEGLAARSRDGRLLAVLGRAGAGNWERKTLLSLHSHDATRERDYLLFQFGAEDGEFDEAELRRGVRRRGAQADRFLVRRGFASLVRLPRLGEPMLRGYPVLTYFEKGEIIVRDPGPGPVRFRGRLHPLVTGRDRVADEHGWVDPCSEPELYDVVAWSIDESHLLIRSTVNPAADACELIDHYSIVEI